MPELPKLTDRQLLHIALMRFIAEALTDTPMVLKGGTSLLLCYQLDRFSEDLDFDSPLKFNLKHRITEAAKRISEIEMRDIDTIKDTDTVQRLRLTYQTPNGVDRLKIETSLRASPVESEVTMVNGIQVYRLEVLIRQKIAALTNRTAARDLHDVNFLIQNYRSHFQPKHLADLSELFHDPGAIESRFKPAYEEDYLLSSDSFQQTLLELMESVEEHRRMTSEET